MEESLLEISVDINSIDNAGTIEGKFVGIYLKENGSIGKITNQGNGTLSLIESYGNIGTITNQNNGSISRIKNQTKGVIKEIINKDNGVE